MREPQIAQFLDSITLKMETIHSSETIHQSIQRNVPEQLCRQRGWMNLNSRQNLVLHDTQDGGTTVFLKRQKPLSVDIALYPKRHESSSTILCAQPHKITWNT
jgi:hypothetical protein